MPKNTKKKSIMNVYMDQFLSLLIPKLAGETDKLLRGLADASRIRRRIQIYAISIAIAMAALTVIFFGIGSMVAYTYPNWPPGLAHIVVGLIFLAWALVYKNAK